MTREEFFEWLNTCPTYGWLNLGEDDGCIRIQFKIDEEEGEQNEVYDKTTNLN